MEEIYGKIYKTTCLINNKIYVGQTIRNRNDYVGGGKIIKNAINKYGFQNFIREWIDEANSQDELDQKEIYWIKELKSQDPKIGYNIDNGGWGKGKVSDLTKEKIKLSSIEMWKNENIRNRIIGSINKRYTDPAYREKWYNIMLNVVQNEDYKLKMAKSTSLAWQDENIRSSRVDGMKKLWQNQELKDQASDKLKNNWKDDKFREKVINSRLETYQTEVYKEKRSKLSQDMWNREEYREKHRLAMIEASKNIRKLTSKRIYCIELNKEFLNVGEAVKELGFTCHENTLRRKINKGVKYNSYTFTFIKGE